MIDLLVRRGCCSAVQISICCNSFQGRAGENGELSGCGITISFYNTYFLIKTAYE
ncbi:MAG: hypothetical protein WAP48_02400 [Sediminibacterium sp.]